VVPGGGMLPAGATFDVYGIGFSPSTKLSVRNVSLDSIQYINSTTLRVKLKQASQIDGALLQVQNPDKSMDNYSSSWSLLNHTAPIFSILTATEASITPAAADSNSFNAIALQNPSLSSAAIAVQLRDASGVPVATTAITLDNGFRITREIFELFGTALPAGGSVHVQSTEPVQVLGLAGNNLTSTVLPAAFTILAGPPPPASGGK
jgi:hypothetical protein